MRNWADGRGERFKRRWAARRERLLAERNWLETAWQRQMAAILLGSKPSRQQWIKVTGDYLWTTAKGP